MSQGSKTQPHMHLNKGNTQVRGMGPKSPHATGWFGFWRLGIWKGKENKIECSRPGTDQVLRTFISLLEQNTQMHWAEELFLRGGISAQYRISFLEPYSTAETIVQPALFNEAFLGITFICVTLTKRELFWSLSFRHCQTENKYSLWQFRKELSFLDTEIQPLRPNTTLKS